MDGACLKKTLVGDSHNFRETMEFGLVDLPISIPTQME